MENGNDENSSPLRLHSYQESTFQTPANEMSTDKKQNQNNFSGDDDHAINNMHAQSTPVQPRIIQYPNINMDSRA